MGIWCVAQEAQIEALYQSEEWDWVEDGRESQKGGDICIPMAESCWSLAENNKIL